MAKTTEQLLQQAVQIRDEQANKKNTALRVGTLFSDIIEKQEESDQTHASDVTKINESINENKEKLTELKKEVDGKISLLDKVYITTLDITTLTNGAAVTSEQQTEVANIFDTDKPVLCPTAGLYTKKTEDVWTQYINCEKDGILYGASINGSNWFIYQYDIRNKAFSSGYVECTTGASTAAKTITVTGMYALSTGIRLLVKMSNNNTATNATLNINSLGAKPLYYNNERVSGDNTWEAGEVIDVYYDGTNFYTSNVLGGAGNGGNMILEWNTDVVTTRKQVLQKDRKAGMQISYKPADSDDWVNEQYTGDEITDVEWEKDSNWRKIADESQLDKIKSTIGDFLNSAAATYGNDITKVLEYLSSSVDVILDKINASVFTEVEWIDTIFGIGDNTSHGYNAWAPSCAKYDEVLGRVVFIQCHTYNHSSGIYPSQLWAINPYDLLDEELLSSIECTRDDVPLGFDIYDGIYYAVGEKSTWKSEDRGSSFTQITHNTLEATYGMQIIDGIMYVGNDAAHEGEIIYYTSSDFGQTFEEHKLEASYEGLKWSEANFLKFKGDLYMCARREELPGLLFRKDNETWTLISDKMPNVSSDCHMYAADNVIAFGAINRPERKLILGTIEIGTDVKIEVKKEYNLQGYTSSGDFHTPTYIYHKDFQMMTFMIGDGAAEYQSANNAAIVGYRNINMNKNIDYSWKNTGNLLSNIIDEPYVGTKFDGFNTIKGNVYNLATRMLHTYPLEENGDILYFYSNPNFKNYMANWLAQTKDYIDSKKHGYISCLIRDPSVPASLADPPYKMIFKAERGVVANINDIGEIVPAGGSFNYVRYCQDLREGKDIPYAYRVAELVE